jgi:hypothetical protein
MFIGAKHDGDSLIVEGKTRVLVVTERAVAPVAVGAPTVERERRYHDVTYRVTISADAIEGLARKATRNKSRRSRMGPAIVQVVTSEVVPDPAF